MPLSVHRIYQHIFKLWRAKRFKLFIGKIQPQRHDRIADIGGYPWFWHSHPPVVAGIDCFNIDEQPWEPSSAPEHHIHCHLGDGCNLDLPDRSYEIAFSNSVIEHVGTWDDQVSFAKEIRRIGNALWVQTPALACPIEPHYLAPFIHWLPKAIRRKLIRFTPWGVIHRPSEALCESMIETIRLLSKREMKQLFPDCEIITERLLGIFPKSYIALRGKVKAECVVNASEL